MALKFSKERLEKMDRIIEKLGSKESALIPVLFLAKEEFGYVSLEAAEYVAGLLGMTPVRVYSTATFYSMVPKSPVGKYHIQVCWNLPCSLMGAEHILTYLEKKLGIKTGETTKDGLITLSGVECLAACGTAPVMHVNKEIYENLTEQKVDKILGFLK